VELNIPDETKESIGKLYSGRKIRWNLDIACLALAAKNLPPSIFLFSFSFPSVNIGTKIAILRIGISTISLQCKGWVKKVVLCPSKSSSAAT
jgi:hypothetical protein